MLYENIKKLRKKSKMSQEELAEKLGVSRQSVSLWETGQTQPTIDNIIALAKIFNTSTDEILGNTATETPKQEDLPDKKKTPIWPFIALMIAAAALIVAIILIVHSCRGTGYGPNREETGAALPTDATHDSGRTSISDTTPPDTTQAPQTFDMTSYVSTEETVPTEPATTEPPVTEPATTEPITTAPVTTKPKETTKVKETKPKEIEGIIHVWLIWDEYRYAIVPKEQRWCEIFELKNNTFNIDVQMSIGELTGSKKYGNGQKFDMDIDGFDNLRDFVVWFDYTGNEYLPEQVMLVSSGYVGTQFRIMPENPFEEQIGTVKCNNFTVKFVVDKYKSGYKSGIVIVPMQNKNIYEMWGNW